MKESLLVVGSCIVAFLLGFQVVFPLLIKQEESVIEGIDENIVKSVKVLGDPPINWNWTIENDTVYINNSWVYLSASPHTIASDGWVEFELESKILSGDIDVIWGFNTSEAKPSNPQIWCNYTHNMTGQRWVEQYLNRTFWVLAGTNLGMENYDNYTVDFGNKNNTWLWELSCYDELYEENYSVIIAFESKTPPGQTPNVNYTFFYYDEAWETYYYDSTFFDWKDFERNITVKNHTWKGFNKWYMVNASIQANHLYRVRCWVDIPFGGLEGNSGKYVWAIKEHSKTIQEAISTGRLIYLDPWWNSNWDHYRTITLDSSKIDNDLINFPVLVVFDNSTFHMDSNKSMRFVAGANSGGTENETEYVYEIEKWDDTGNCYVWVNVTRVYSATDTVFNMYYNNSDASGNQNPSGVWDSNYVAVYHMNDTDDGLFDSTGNNNHATEDVSDPSDADDYKDTGKVGYAVNYDGEGVAADSENHDMPDIMSNAEWNSGFTISYWCKFTTVANYRTSLALQESTSIYSRLHSNGTFTFLTYDGANYQYLYSLTAVPAVWYHVTATYDGTTKEFFINGTNKVTVEENTLNDGSSGNDIGAMFNDKWGMDGGIIDNIYISKINRNDSWIIADFHNQNQTTGFMSFGSEQSAISWQPVYSWNISFGNTTSWIIGVHWNVSFRNTSLHQTLFHWNVSFRNVAVNNTIFHWNVSFKNTSVYTSILHWNVSFQNHSNQPPVINFTSPTNNSMGVALNIHWFNFTVYDNNSDLMWNNATLIVEGCAQHYDSPAAFSNGTVSMLVGPGCLPLQPLTTYSWWVNVTDDYTWTNETYYFTTIGNRSVFDWNISFRNTSTNKSLLHWNASFRNSTANVTYYSTMHWNTSYRNSTLNLTNYTIYHWNLSFKNTSISVIDIYNEFPTNRSTDIPRYIHLQIAFNHSLNYRMNITWMWGYNDTCTEILGYTNNLLGGDVHKIFTNASQYNTTYYWKVNVSDGVGNYIVETYWFNTSFESVGGGYGYILVGAAGVVGLIGVIGLLGYFLRRREEND